MPTFLLTWVMLLALVTIDVNACTCEGDNSIVENVRMASTIFSGTVLSQKTLKTKGFDWLVYTIKLDKLFKGQVKSKTVAVWTATRSESCGVKFGGNQKIVIYGYTSYQPVINELDPNHTFIYTTLCTRSGAYVKTEEAEIRLALHNH